MRIGLARSFRGLVRLFVEQVGEGAADGGLPEAPAVALGEFFVEVGVAFVFQDVCQLLVGFEDVDFGSVDGDGRFVAADYQIEVDAGCALSGDTQQEGAVIYGVGAG